MIADQTTFVSHESVLPAQARMGHFANGEQGMQVVTTHLTQCFNRRRNEGRDTTVGRYLLRREVAFIARSLGDATRPRRLLDLCCGSGSVTRLLHNTGLHVVGLDIDLVALGIFRRLSNQVPLVLGDALRLPLADGGLDCVVAIHCFDHLDRIQFLQECNRVLCNGGLLIFDSLNQHSYKWVLKRLRRSLGLDPPGNWSDKWINILSCGEVLRATANCGFEIQAVSGYNWVPFTQESDNNLVDTAALIEQALRLDCYYNISPRILIAARKNLFGRQSYMSKEDRNAPARS